MLNYAAGNEHLGQAYLEHKRASDAAYAAYQAVGTPEAFRTFQRIDAELWRQYKRSQGMI